MTGADAGTWRKALAEDDWSRHLTTLDGWRKFTTAEARPPDLPDGPQREAMTEADQEHYDEYRLDYHTRLAAAATSTLRQVVTTGRRLTLLNRHAVSARRGMILSGAAGTGKTTAVTQFGNTREAIDRLRHPGIGNRIPVIYVTVPPTATPRMLAVEFPVLRPAADRPGEHHRRDRGRLRRRGRRPGERGMREIHNLQLATRSGAEVSEYIGPPVTTLAVPCRAMRRYHPPHRMGRRARRQGCPGKPGEARRPGRCPITWS